MDTSIPAVRIATGTDVKQTATYTDVKTPEWVQALPPPEPMTHRAWCGLCGTYVYDQERMPCSDKPDAWENCGLNGQSTEQVPMSYRKDHEEQKKVSEMLKHQRQHHQVTPLTPYGVQELLQRDTGDETDFHDFHEQHQVAEMARNNPIGVKRSLVEEAMSITDGARRKAYGTPEDNFSRIALLWSAYDQAAYRNNVPRNVSHDIAMKMILMKIARIIETPDHRDSYTDIIGYTLCGAEIAGVALNSEAVGVK